MDEDWYGLSITVENLVKYKQVTQSLSSALDAGLCVSQSTGELILERQVYILQALNILVEDILEAGSSSRMSRTRPRKHVEGAHVALFTLSIDPKPEKLPPVEILACAVDQKSSLEEYIDLCRTEPAFLTHVVNTWFSSRPELVPDEKGRSMPLATDKFIRIAVFEVIHNAVIGAAVWGYLCSLLHALVDQPNDRFYWSTILHEIAEVSHFEHCRAQKLFKRYVQMASGSKFFKRVSGVYDNGTARVAMKIKPDLLTRVDPQMHYILCLCQAKLDVSQAVDWIRKLDGFHQALPTEQGNITEREFDAFCDLAVTASFIQSLSVSLPSSPSSLGKGRCMRRDWRNLEPN